MAKLVFQSEPFAGRTFELAKEKTTVGREARHDLVIHHDSISHQHCEILVNGHEVIVRDLGSKNGTFVEGVRLLDAQTQLRHGQIVCFGSIKARLDLDDGMGDSDTSVTVATLFNKYDEAKRKKAKKKSPGDAPLMELGTDENESDQTVILSEPPISSASASDANLPRDHIPESEPSQVPGQRHGRTIIIAVIIGILGIILLLALRK